MGDWESVSSIDSVDCIEWRIDRESDGALQCLNIIILSIRTVKKFGVLTENGEKFGNLRGEYLAIFARSKNAHIESGGVAD